MPMFVGYNGEWTPIKDLYGKGASGEWEAAEAIYVGVNGEWVLVEDEYVPPIGPEDDPSVMVLTVDGPINIDAEWGASKVVGLEYSQDGITWLPNSPIWSMMPTTAGKVYVRVLEGGPDFDRIRIGRSSPDFLGIDKWWDVGASIALGGDTDHNFTVPDHAPPNVTNMSYMFTGARGFDQDISGWDTSNVTDMAYMFYNAYTFNQDLSGWDVSGVTDMSYMFYNATTFNQDLSGWCVSNIPTKPSGFDSSTTAWVKEGRQPIWGTCPNGGT